MVSATVAMVVSAVIVDLDTGAAVTEDVIEENVVENTVVTDRLVSKFLAYSYDRLNKLRRLGHVLWIWWFWIWVW